LPHRRSLAFGGKRKVRNGMGQNLDIANYADEAIEEFSYCVTGECRINVLPMLYKLSQVIAESEDLEHSLSIILGFMQKRMKVLRGAVTLYERGSETIFIHNSFGFSDQEKARGVCAPGEGITGEVVETGLPIIVPHLADDSRFPVRIQAHCDDAGMKASFFCVPIIHAKKVLGAISAERAYISRELLKQDMELISTIGSMIAPAVELYLTENFDKVRLENENRRLLNEVDPIVRTTGAWI
jgi:Nif-specific regulatory protein